MSMVNLVRVMTLRKALAVSLTAALVVGVTATASGQYTKHSEFQAVDDDGQPTQTFSLSDATPATFQGVVLNNPENMLDITPNYSTTPLDQGGSIGGQWQIFIQAVEAGDWGGTCLWMGQNYGNLPWIRNPARSYYNDEWQAELDRLNVTPGEPQPFRAGDLIEVHARGTLFYKGKQNINEEHWNTPIRGITDPNKDFEITIAQRGYGLPESTRITLSDVKDAADQYIFGATDPDGDGIPLPLDQVIGCEKYQSQLITLLDVRLLDGEAGKWAPGATLLMTDDSNRTFPMILGVNPDLALITPPSGTFDLTGIFDQDSSDNAVGTDGYRLYVTSPSQVPEPGAAAMAISGLLALLMFGLVRRRKGL